MVFSLFFIYIFLPLCLITYAAAGSIKNKNTVLIIFSLIFYAWGEPVYVFLMLLSAVVNYFAGLIIRKYQGTGKDTAATAAAVVFDFLMLGIFKYSGFIVENINAVFSASIHVPDIKLPIGISFYTFQTVSYIIDCHWEKVKPQRSLKNFLLYITLFPQLVAGPIVRYSTIEKEIESRKVSLKDISYGLNRVALTSRDTPISLSVSDAFSDFTLTKTSTTRSSVRTSPNSGRGGTFPSARSSATICSISRFSENAENTADFSSSGSAQAFGTVQAGTLFSGVSTTAYSFSSKCRSAKSA